MTICAGRRAGMWIKMSDPFCNTDRSSFVGLGQLRFLKHAAEEAHDMRVFLAADKADVRARQHGMEEVSQFVILRIHAVLPEPDVHHARVVAQTLDV